MAPPRKESPQARRLVWSKGHALADKRGYVLESRLILFSKIGADPVPCHWCKGLVVWSVGVGPVRGSLVADHIDGNHHNNAPSNLVPACQGCNGTRFKLVKDDELFITKRDGKRVRAVPRTCLRCASPFLVPPAALKRPNKGLFCSRPCARKKPITQLLP